MMKIPYQFRYVVIGNMVLYALISPIIVGMHFARVTDLWVNPAFWVYANAAISMALVSLVFSAVYVLFRVTLLYDPFMKRYVVGVFLIFTLLGGGIEIYKDYKSDSLNSPFWLGAYPTHGYLTFSSESPTDFDLPPAASNPLQTQRLYVIDATNPDWITVKTDDGHSAQIAKSILSDVTLVP
jgi:hypothetical protein